MEINKNNDQYIVEDEHTSRAFSATDLMKILIKKGILKDTDIVLTNIQ